jgi:hypothetical protein
MFFKTLLNQKLHLCSADFCRLVNELLLLRKLPSLKPQLMHLKVEQRRSKRFYGDFRVREFVCPYGVNHAVLISTRFSNEG